MVLTLCRYCLVIFVFEGLRLVEYFDASFSISDSVYGSTFFIATGFHRFHVVVGTLFLLACFRCLKLGRFGKTYPFGLKAAI